MKKWRQLSKAKQKAIKRKMIADVKNKKKEYWKLKKENDDLFFNAITKLNS